MGVPGMTIFTRNRKGAVSLLSSKYRENAAIRSRHLQVQSGWGEEKGEVVGRGGYMDQFLRYIQISLEDVTGNAHHLHCIVTGARLLASTQLYQFVGKVIPR